MSGINIRAVATKTGLNAATLRTWERRYNAVTPVRQANGSRLYSESAVARVRLLKRATELGHAISNIAELDDSSLEQLLGDSPQPGNANPQSHCVEQLLNSIEQMDLTALERLVGIAALAFAPLVLVEEILAPVLREVGSRWKAGKLSIAEEHAVSACLAGALSQLQRLAPPSSSGHPVLLATLPGDRHELALQMVRHVLAGHGVPVAYLGVDLPVEEIVQSARRLGCRMIALSSIYIESVPSQREQLSKLLAGLDTSIEVWLGGSQAPNLAEGLNEPRLHLCKNLRELEQRAWYVGN